MKKLALALVALSAVSQAGAVTITQAEDFSTLDQDGGGRLKFDTFDGTLGTLTDVRYFISGSYRNFGTFYPLPGVDPQPPGDLTLTAFFFANVLGADAPVISQAQTFAFEGSVAPLHVQLDFAESIPLPLPPDVTLDAFVTAPGWTWIEADYSAGIPRGPGLPPIGKPTIDGQAVLTYEYEPVPEPATWLVLTAGLAALTCCRRKRGIGE